MVCKGDFFIFIFLVFGGGGVFGEGGRGGKFGLGGLFLVVILGVFVCVGDEVFCVLVVDVGGVKFWLGVIGLNI